MWKNDKDNPLAPESKAAYRTYLGQPYSASLYLFVPLRQILLDTCTVGTCVLKRLQSCLAGAALENLLLGTTVTSNSGMCW